MKIETIEEKLFSQADKELNQRITAAAKSLYEEAISKTPSDSRVELHTDAGPTVSVRPYLALVALTKLAFDSARDQNRQKKLNEFMERVDDLSAQIEDLQHSIH